MGRISLFCAAGWVALILSMPANAQQADGPARADAAGIVDELAACRSLTDATQRLACFDRTATTLIAARDRKDIVVMDREGMRKTRRSLFGFALPKIKLFGGAEDDEPEIKEITSKVVVANSLGMGKWEAVLEDGSHWQTTEPTKSMGPRPGNMLRVKRATMGGYFMYLGGAAVRAKRVDRAD
jgi:hypothetical protein